MDLVLWKVIFGLAWSHCTRYGRCLGYYFTYLLIVIDHERQEIRTPH